MTSARSWLVSFLLIAQGLVCACERTHRRTEADGGSSISPGSGGPGAGAMQHDGSVPARDAGARRRDAGVKAHDAAMPMDAAVPGPDARVASDGSSMDASMLDGGADSGVDAGSHAGGDAGTDSGAHHDNDAGMPVCSQSGPYAHEDSDAGAEDDAGPPALEITGSWHSNYGGTEVVESGLWSSYDAAWIVEYDNANNWLIEQNPPTALYSPCKFRKIVWTEIHDGSFYYCTVDYGLDSADAARNSQSTADASDPASGGCGGFAWTLLSTPIAVAGTWTDGASSLTIDSDTWGPQAIASYDNAHGSAITQNPSSDPHPLAYNKVLWTALDRTQFYFCVVASDQATAADAESHAASAHPEDLVTGCNGAAWMRLYAP